MLEHSNISYGLRIFRLVTSRSTGKPRGMERSVVVVGGRSQLIDVPSPGSRRAVAYVRMSTDHQKYSTDNQMDAIRDYAAQNGIEIIRTYADEGKSGMQVKGRDAFLTMIETIKAGRADFDLIVVYDHSRWGRFQRFHEAEYYAYLCLYAGVEVHFCAGGFPNDMGPLSALAWTINSMQASNYSRDLSAKVWAGQCRLIRMGYRQGGPPGYGLRRLLLDESGASKFELKHGERKSLQTDRVILKPGPATEVRRVRWIYEQFTRQGQSETAIARALNEKGIVTDLGRAWTSGTVRQILTNEKYIGNNVFNRTSAKLTAKRRANVREDWVRAQDAFTPIVSKENYLAAQLIFDERNQQYSNDEMLKFLTNLFQKHGTLSGIIIDEANGMPSSGAYKSRFGSLIRAYELIGFVPERDYRYIEVNRALRMLHRQTVSETINALSAQDSVVIRNPATDLLTINSEFTVSIILARCRETDLGARRWKIRFDASLSPDITIAIRMNGGNDAPLDYYFLPRNELTSHRLGLSEENGFMLDAYRYENLNGFVALSRRSRISTLEPW